MPRVANPIIMVSLALSAALVSVWAMGTPVSAEPAPALGQAELEVLKQHCFRCHSAAKAEGGVRLDDLPLSISTVGVADRWQKILNQLNSGAIPPEGAKSVAAAAKADFLDALSTRMAAAHRFLSDSGGQSVIRRLNRREYLNTIRDLLGVDISTRELPADGGAGTFDTVGSSLFMSADQIEQYQALGRQALDEHFARFAPSRASRRMRLEAEDRNARIAQSLKDRIDARDRYLKWTAGVDAAALKPENAETVTRIKEGKKDDTALYFHWQKIPGAPAPKDFGFVDAIHADEQG